MGRPAAVAMVVAMVALIVVVDIVFLRGHFLLRLMVNVGIVVVFAAAYFGLRGRH